VDESVAELPQQAKPTQDAAPPPKGEAVPVKPHAALRWKRGGATAAIGSLLAFLLMANDGQLRLGVPLGAVAVTAAAWGFMDLLGTFDDAEEGRLGKSLTLRALAPALGRATAALLVFLLALVLAQSGVVNQWVCGGLVTASFLGWVAMGFELGVVLGPWAKDETGKARALTKRHGFWVLVAGALLYLPTLGIYSLYDPWETHYAEVARGILQRDDWISLWWSYQGWFYSKPILELWLMALSMGTLGTHYESDHMLIGTGRDPIMHPEWAVRIPNVLFTLLAMYVLYKGVAKAYGRRAGLLGALVLATMTDWFMLGRQCMTDMACIAAMGCAVGLVMIGMHEDETKLAPIYEVKTGKISWRLSAWHLVFGAVIVTALPQVIYLLSRNLELLLHGTDAHGFLPHWDQFRAGNPGDCGLPGNDNCALTNPASIPKGMDFSPDGFGPSVHRLFGSFEPVLQALVWAVGLGVILYLNWNERRTRRLAYTAAWYLAGVATMAKGPEGLALPAAAVFVWIIATKRWRELLQLEIVTGLLVWAVLVFPWFVASYIRHGSPFTDELLFHDMFNRAFDHVHDTNAGDDTSIRFYLWQLGYALFPWTGIAPIALFGWMKRATGRTDAERRKYDVAVLLFAWAIIAFALFTFMGTKFHHYILPMAAPVAMLIGIWIDDLLTQRAENATDGGATHERLMVSATLVAAALVTLLVGRDFYFGTTVANQPGAIRILHLITYNYSRAWPDTVDMSATLRWLTVGVAVAVVLVVSWRYRRQAIYALGAAALVWAVWGIDVYTLQIAPHWGQRELMEAYYSSRSGPDELLVAYQMNWKGENFYTGNHLPVFVSSGGPFTNWLKTQRDKGTKVMYFVTEHSRIGGLKSEVKASQYKELTDKALNNKFVLVRAIL
jgi:4-amino-4-deoxy-L-arabinose transferase-like glycosyltransferase